jgi:hypothetical protein
MSDPVAGVRRRVEKIEQTLANIGMRRRLPGCTCCDLTAVLDPKDFEEQMNLPCPAHGFRDLGTLMVVRYERAAGGSSDPSLDEDPRDVELDRLLEMYDARRDSSRNTDARLDEVGLENSPEEH